MKRLAMVTGASGGIGKALAWELAKSEFDVIVTGRRKELLEDLKVEIQGATSAQIYPWSFDISSRAQCEQVFKDNQKALTNLSVLVNNAGLAKGVEPLTEGHIEDWETMIDTNMKGLLFATRLAMPYLKANGSKSHIVNLGSVAGQWVYPGGGVYCATKFAVGALSQGLRMDLHGSGVRVTNISPGMVETEFSEVRLGDSAKAKAVYEKMQPLSPQNIADNIMWCLKQPPHVNIQEMTIFPTDQAAVGMVHRS